MQRLKIPDGKRTKPFRNRRLRIYSTYHCDDDVKNGNVKMAPRHPTTRFLVRKIKAGENGAAFTTESVVETPHDVRPYNATDSEPRSHPVIFDTDVFEIPEDLPRIEERSQFKIRHDPGQPGAGNVDPLFN